MLIRVSAEAHDAHPRPLRLMMLIHASAEAHDAHPRVRAGSWCFSGRPIARSANAHRLERARPQAALAPDCPRADAQPGPLAHARPPSF